MCLPTVFSAGKTCSEALVQTIRWVHVIKETLTAPYFSTAQNKKREAKKYHGNEFQKQQLTKGKYELSLGPLNM